MDVIDRPLTDNCNVEVEKLQNGAYEEVETLLKEIRGLKAEIRSREGAIVSICKKYKISAVLE
ncbi:MAG: hypothetical protein SVJ22_00495 [Halobacteriota archaeon]|nr:hypothetical protein [Halobacteriota archaeon]